MALETSKIIKESVTLAMAQRGSVLPLYVIAALAGSLLSALATSTAFVVAGAIVPYPFLALTAAQFYRRALPASSGKSLITDGGRLLIARILVEMLFLIVVFLCALFLVLLAGIFLGTEGFDPELASNDPGEYVRAFTMIASSVSGWILITLLVIATMGLIWLALRLILFGVATVDAGHLRIFQTWKWTSGHALSIVPLSSLLILLPWCVALLLQYTLEAQLLPVDAEAGAVLIGASEFSAWILLYPVFLLGHGLAVSLYRRLSPEQLDVEMAFD